MNSIFINKEITAQIEKNGFVVKPLLEQPDLISLQQSFKALKKKANNSIKKTFWPSGRHEDPLVRNFAKQEIEKVVPKRLEQFIDLEKTDLIGGTFLVKPPSRKSALNPHQDSSHVDERNGFSVYAWIPLQDVTKWNGRFHYLPHSHTWGIHQRSLSVPWPLKENANDLWKFMKPIPMRAGEVLFFHSALIHSSPANFSFKTRLAVNYYLHPKGTPFCHFYKDEQTPLDKVEMFEVTPDFFYSEDFESRPDSSKYKLLDTIDESKFDPKILKRLLLK